LHSASCRMNKLSEVRLTALFLLVRTCSFVTVHKLADRQTIMKKDIVVA
jgi:hypothetical protein